MEIFLRIILISIYSILCNGFDYTVLEQINHNSLDGWLRDLNIQYHQLNRQSALYTWELSVNPSDELYDGASEFGGIRSKWRNIRCTEANHFLHQMTQIQKRMINILCRGPKFTEQQGSELSELLTRIQDIYTDSQICLPSGFDICINYNQIWDYTYVRDPKNVITPLDMSLIAPKLRSDFNPLHYFDGNLSDDYYVFRGAQNYRIEMDDKSINKKIRQSTKFCMGIEPDLEKLMTGNFAALQRSDCALPSDLVLHWAWEAWRLAVGPEIGKYYPKAVNLMNIGARNNGYNDIGETWREELEIDNLRGVVNNLWNQIKPYYRILHAILRNALFNKYDGDDIITRNSPIPAHLLGNMWSQDWSSYHQLLVPFTKINLDENLMNTNWTTLDMVRRADDYYTSIGLNPMTDKFWTYSHFEKATNTTKCHGSAANMFSDDNDDFRMIVCAEKTFEDFYVIVHEMGHLQYYMHLGKQPTIFQDAANSALGEAIGDAIFLAMMTPSHLNRLGLLPDKYLFTENLERFKTNEIRIVHEHKLNPEFLKAPTNDDILDAKLKETNFDPEMINYLQNLLTDKLSREKIEPITINDQSYPKISKINEKIHNFMNFKGNHDQSMNSFDLNLLLRIGLSKLPQIPFEYIVDTFRWDLFNGKISFDEANTDFWKLCVQEQGIHPPKWENRKHFFDAASKFHVADNTPYVRYFLASFLQAQIFKGLCEVSIFGRFNTNQKIPMPLHRCDFYGSKRAGRLLKKAMKLGSSVHWTEPLYILTGTKEISVEPLIEYYQPLFSWLEQVIIDYDIPVGW